MSLKSVRMIQRLVGVLLLVYGIYLIFGTQEFFGTILIIVAFLIFPSLNKEKKRSYSNDVDDSDRYNDSADDNDSSYGGGDSGGGDGGD
ncbi:hypothetical protein BABA_06521 [Neobacillus bataviensis LMG 21833]|uniref:Uncharacterized protein n=1 Tax=Neobacillus bataviensis LMG 21833 TaxID=1117379 RepID=K6E9X7_9BACI|nr:hypothetical protein [Neobacillus bataviensis]EKN70181.1 hypothetical protein BABA_06521 [Neobacillus bataviensis LMG 21833]